MEQNARMFERLMTARSIEQAMEIQSDHAKLAYDNYMQEMTKLGSMYASFAREAYKPAGSSQASS